MLNLCKSNPATRLYPIHKSLYIIRYKTTELSQTPLASAAHHPLLPPVTCRLGHHQINILNKKKPAHPVNHKAERDRSPPASSLSTLGIDTVQSRIPLQGRTESMIRSGGKEGVQAAYIEEENENTSISFPSI